MLPTTENVGLVIESLENLFGAPEYIIDTMFSSVRTRASIKDGNIEKLIPFSSQFNKTIS